MKLDLPVMVTILLCAAVVQVWVPLCPGSLIKIPFLTAAAAYYALQHERALALTAAIWSGILTDATDGLPFICTAGYLVVAVFVLRHVRANLQAGMIWQGVAALAVAAPLQLLWQVLFGGVLPPEWNLGWLFFGVVLAVPCGAVAAMLVFSMAGALDRLAGNVKGLGQKDGVSWSQCT